MAKPVIGDGHLRVTMGHAFREPLLKADYKVSPHTNRQAIFLDGPAVEAPAGNMITEGVPLGGIQLPPSGQPMILFVDQQTTGGYPNVACVIHRDIPKLGHQILNIRHIQEHGGQLRDRLLERDDYPEEHLDWIDIVTNQGQS